MAKEATMNTTTETPVQKTAYQLQQEQYRKRIIERNKKSGDLVAEILLGTDLSKITKTQIREIHQFIRRHFEWAEFEREAAWKATNNFALSAQHLKAVELATRALNIWTNYKARIVAEADAR
jgi:hypothetical protein